MSNDVVPNRVGELMEERGLKGVELARMTGLAPSKISRIINHKCNMDAGDFVIIARALSVTPGDLFVISQSQVETLPAANELVDGYNPIPRAYQFWLSATGDDASWLWQGIANWRSLLEKGEATETPSEARIRLMPGRVLIGRAVDEDSRFAEIPATQRISIARDLKEHPEDRSVSRFQCDLTVPYTDDIVAVFAKSNDLYVNHRQLQEGDTAILERRDKLIFPNGITLYLERERLK